jgi:hypothetical protein
MSIPIAIEFARKATWRMTPWLVAFAAICTGALGHPTTAKADILKSPIDIQTQTTLFANSSVPFECLRPQKLPSKVESIAFYTDERASVTDEARYRKYLEMRKPISDEETFLALSNTAYVRLPSQRRAIAACLKTHLLALAEENAFVGSDDIRGGGAVRLMSVTPLISVLLLKDDPVLTESDRAKVTDWISRLMTRFEWLEARFVYHNNIEDWTVAAEALAAIALNRRELLERAANSVREKLARITPDGVLEEETARGVMAVDYSLSAAQAITITVLAAQTNGIDMMSGSSGQALLRMMNRLALAIDDPESFLKFVSSKDAVAKGHFERTVMGWLAVFYRLTNSPLALRTFCVNRPYQSWLAGGDWNVFFGNPSWCANQ